MLVVQHATASKFVAEARAAFALVRVAGLRDQKPTSSQYPILTVTMGVHAAFVAGDELHVLYLRAGSTQIVSTDSAHERELLDKLSAAAGKFEARLVAALMQGDGLKWREVRVERDTVYALPYAVTPLPAVFDIEDEQPVEFAPDANDLY